MAIFEAQLPIKPGYTEIIDMNGNHVYMPTPAMERETQKDEEINLLKQQLKAASDQNEFLEDCVAEMAQIVYA